MSCIVVIYDGADSAEAELVELVCNEVDPECGSMCRKIGRAPSACKAPGGVTANLDRYQQMLEQSDNGHIFGSTVQNNRGEQGFFYHTCNSCLLADVYPVVPLTLQAKAGGVGFGGTRNWNYIEVVTQRDDLRLASMAWRTLYKHPIATVLPVSGAGTTLAAWAPFTGIGRFILKGGEALVPRVVSHEESISASGFVTGGVIEWRSAAGQPLIHQQLDMQARPGEPVLLKEKSTALAGFELAANEQWYMSVANDLHNCMARQVRDQRGKVHKVRALAGKETSIGGGFQIVVDDIIRFEADRELTYFAPGKRLVDDNRFECTQFDRVLVRAGIGSFEANDPVRTGILRVDVL